MSELLHRSWDATWPFTSVPTRRYLHHTPGRNQGGRTCQHCNPPRERSAGADDKSFLLDERDQLTEYNDE